MKTSFVQRRGQNKIAIILGTTLLMIVCANSLVLGDDQPLDMITEQATAEWLNGATIRALDILDQGIRDYPHTLTLHKLRGDVLATSRREQDALEAYETVLQKTPDVLDVRWSKWSVLFRSGQSDRAITEF